MPVLIKAIQVDGGIEGQAALGSACLDLVVKLFWLLLSSVTTSETLNCLTRLFDSLDALL